MDRLRMPWKQLLVRVVAMLASILLRNNPIKFVSHKNYLDCSVTRERELADNPGKKARRPELGQWY